MTGEGTVGNPGRQCGHAELSEHVRMQSKEEDLRPSALSSRSPLAVSVPSLLQKRQVIFLTQHPTGAGAGGGAEGKGQAFPRAVRSKALTSSGWFWWFVFYMILPPLSAILFVKGSYFLGWIYWLYLESIFSKGVMADSHSYILSWGVKRSETVKEMEEI